MSQSHRTIFVIALLLFTRSTARAADDADLARQVGTILRQRCASCHGEEKQKSKLRLDSASAIVDASRRLGLVVAGAPEKSLLLQRIALPADHVDVMPPEGDPLPSVQVSLVRRWIESGAKLDGFDEPAHASKPPEERFPEVSPADPHLLRRLRARGGVVVPVARDSFLLDIGFPESGNRITDADMEIVAQLGERVWRLDLSRISITNAGIRRVADLPNLHTLHLRGTGIKEDTLAMIVKMAGLRRLNLAETALTPLSIDALAKQRPDIAIIGTPH